MTPAHWSVDATEEKVLVAVSDESLVWVEIGSECVVWSDRTRQLHRLDQNASLVFKLCDGSTTLAQTVDELALHFGVARSQMQADVHACAQLLLDTGLVTLSSRHHSSA